MKMDVGYFLPAVPAHPGQKFVAAILNAFFFRYFFGGDHYLPRKLGIFSREVIEAFYVPLRNYQDMHRRQRMDIPESQYIGIFVNNISFDLFFYDLAKKAYRLS